MLQEKKIDFRSPENARKLADALARHFTEDAAKLPKIEKVTDQKGA